jgi:hypothetical protein
MLAIRLDPAYERAVLLVPDRTVLSDYLSDHLGHVLGIGVGYCDDGVQKRCDRCLAYVQKVDVVLFATGCEKRDGETTTSCSACATGTVDVRLWIAGRVYLNDEVDGWDVETTGCDIGCEKDGGCGCC